MQVTLSISDDMQSEGCEKNCPFGHWDAENPNKFTCEQKDRFGKCKIQNGIEIKDAVSKSYEKGIEIGESKMQSVLLAKAKELRQEGELL